MKLLKFEEYNTSKLVLLYLFLHIYEWLQKGATLYKNKEEDRTISYSLLTLCIGESAVLSQRIETGLVGLKNQFYISYLLFQGKRMGDKLIVGVHADGNKTCYKIRL